MKIGYLDDVGPICVYITDKGYIDNNDNFFFNIDEAINYYICHHEDNFRPHKLDRIKMISTIFNI
jgi:hypothetical protein